MSTATLPQIERVEAEAEEPDPPYEFTADQFLAMIEAEVFPEEVRVYLHEGRVLQKMAKTRPHWVLGSHIQEALMLRLPRGWKAVSEAEFKLDRKNAALPDLAVVRGENLLALLDGREIEIGLAVEVAVTSLAKDLGPNSRRYAKAMIPTYWVADFAGRRILAHTGPRVVGGRGEYERVEVVTAGGSIPLVLDGQEVARFAYEELMP